MLTILLCQLLPQAAKWIQTQRHDGQRKISRAPNPLEQNRRVYQLSTLSAVSSKQDAYQLDEAHNIKERATNTAKAAFELMSDFKWCLSGTPLQNRVGELYSLVRFLGGDPFSYYFCTLSQPGHLS